MSENNLLETASQDDPEAIATLLNRALQSQGITANVTIKDECLHVALESDPVPTQQDLVPMVRQGVTNLRISSVRSVKVYGLQTGKSIPAWFEEFLLAQPQVVASPIEPQPQNTSEASDDSEFIDNLQKILLDSLKGTSIFFVNPIGGIAPFFRSLGKQRSISVGIVFGVFYLLSVLFSFEEALQRWIGYASTGRLVLLSVCQFVSLMGANTIIRTIFKSPGSIEGDVFTAGITLLAPGCFLILSKVLGAENVDIVALLGIIAATYTILILYSCCTQISKFSDKVSPLAISLILISSSWLTKLIFTSLS